MNWIKILAWTSGPVGVLVRYGLNSLGVWLIARGFMTDDGWAQISGGLLSALPVIIGTINSSPAVKKAAAAQLPDVVSVETTKGTIRG